CGRLADRLPAGQPSRGALPGGSVMLILSRAEIACLMDFTDYVDAVEAGFRAAATGAALAPPAAAFHVPGGSYHAKAAALLAGDPPVVAVKLKRKYTRNPDGHRSRTG